MTCCFTVSCLFLQESPGMWWLVMMVSPKRSIATPPPGTSLPCHPPSLIAGEGSRRWEDKASLKTGEERERSGLGMASSHLPAHLSLDHNDGQFFRAMEWLMFFFRPPLPSMVFQWFWQSWTITIECFLGGPTIGTNGFSMVFKILRAMVNNGFEVNDGVPGQDHITKWW